MMSPFALTDVANMPSDGVQLYRMASQPALASSVTSNRSSFQVASDEAISLEVPGRPCQASSDLRLPGAAG